MIVLAAARHAVRISDFDFLIRLHIGDAIKLKLCHTERGRCIYFSE